MALSGRTKRVLEQAMADKPSSDELYNAVNAASGDLGTPSTPVTPVVVTFTANTPASYGTPTNAVTVADGTALVAAEVFAYLDNLRANIASLQAILHAHGLTT